MTYFKVLWAGLALGCVVCTAPAQTTLGLPTFSDPGFSSISDLQVTLTIANGYNGDFYAYLVDGGENAGLLNPVRDLAFQATLSDGGNDVQKYLNVPHSFNEDGQLTGSWTPDGYIDPDSFLETSLLGSFYGLDPNGSWTLFLSDLEIGEERSLINWGVVITAVPEPSSSTLLALGAGALGLKLFRRRV